MIQANEKRQYQVYNIMSKSAYSEKTKKKNDSILEYN